MYRLALSALLLIACFVAHAGDVTVAVASNFSKAADALIAEYPQPDGHRIRISTGSTGKLYAQINNGAPFDIFLAADAERPTRLERAGIAVAGSRFTYAFGRLVLWSATDPVTDGAHALRRGDFQHLALANARIAPYGRAAEQVLRNLQLSEALQPRLVRGENIAQTFQFVASGTAELGFVALSQLASPAADRRRGYWTVPQSLYSPIEQQAVLLRDRPAARRFYRFLASAVAREIIDRYGYRLPEEQSVFDE